MAPPAKDWSAAYQLGNTPWDLRAPTPALEALIEDGWLERHGIVAGQAAAVPGCGRGHDVRLLERAGLSVSGFDLADEVVTEARELLRWNRTQDAQILRRDVLGLLPEFGAWFDLVYEYTCFCALPPHLRHAYAKQLVGILKPGGILLALVFPLLPERTGKDGPPFLVEDGALEVFDQPLERIDSFEPVRSAPGRAGAERWFAWRKPR